MHRIATQLAAGSIRHARRSSPAFLRTLGARSLHNRVTPPYNVGDGMGDFLSPASLKLIAEDYQQGLLDRLNDEIKDTPQRSKSVVQTVIEAAQDPSKILMFNYASEALNNSFFLQCLSPPRADKPNHEDDIDSYLGSRIRGDYGSIAQLKSTFSATVIGMFGSGWVWLVCDQNGQLAVIPTFGTGTLLIRSQERLQARLKLPETVIGEEPAAPRPRTIPGVNVSGQTSSSPASGISSQQPPQHPPKQTRQFSSSAFRALNIPAFNPASLHDTGNKAPMGDILFPLLCISVHEHAWVSAGYGVWGKEEYMKRFWSVVNWKQVSSHFGTYCPNRQDSVGGF